MSDEFLNKFSERCETEIPNVRRVGRYAFFAFCALGTGVLPAVFLGLIGVPRDITDSTIAPAAMIVFLTLREMSKDWDMALQARAAIAKAKGDAA